MSTASNLREALDVKVDELIHTYTREIIGQNVHQIQNKYAHELTKYWKKLLEIQ